MDLSQGKFVDDTEETILVKDKVVNGYGSDTPAVAKLRYGVSDAPSTYARQMDEVKSFLSDMSDNKTRYIASEEDALAYAVAPQKEMVGSTKKEMKQSNIAGNILAAGATTATSGFYGAEMAGASVPTWIKNVGLGYKYYADLLFKSEEERSTPEYMAQWAERARAEDAVVDAVKEIHKRSEEVAGKIGDALGVGEESIGSFIGQTTGSVLTSLGICYLTKNPALTAATFALPTYGNVLGTSVEKGKDLTTSTGFALASATGTGILENWGLQNLIENITTKTLRAAIAKTMTTESIEELSQQVVEDLPLIFWAKDEQFVNEDGSIKWWNVIKDLASAAFGGALGGSIGAGIGASVVNRQRNNLIDNLTKNEKYSRGEAETIVAYLEDGDEAARAKYEQTYVQKIGEQKSYDDFIKNVPEIQQAKQVMDSVKEEMSNPENVAKVTAETMNEALDPANLPNESLDEYAKMVKDSKEQITQQMEQQAEEERKKYDVRDIVESRGADERTIEATKEAVQSFAEAEAEEFGVTPRQAVEGKTLTLANLSDNSGLSPQEKQQILEQSGLAKEDTVVAKESGEAPTQEELDEAYAMMEAEKGAAVGEDGQLRDENGNVLFQDVAQRINEIDAEEQANGVPEYTAPTININGVERLTTNSSGEPIAKSEKSLRYFYDWFGDSKVVDEQGRPLVVYHGTNAEFDTFDISKAGNATNAKNTTLGFFFTPHEDYAKTIGNKIMPVYLKALNMFEVGFAKNGEDYLTGNKKERLNVSHFSKEYKFVDGLESIKEAVIKKYGDYNKENVAKWSKLIKDMGYDGIKVITGDTPTFESDFIPTAQYVVFDPNQIKSISNRGTFSSSENIYLQSAFAGSRVDYDRPSLKYIGSNTGKQTYGYGLYYTLERPYAERYRHGIDYPGHIYNDVAEYIVEKLSRESNVNIDKEDAIKIMDGRKDEVLKTYDFSKTYQDAISKINPKTITKEYGEYSKKFEGYDVGQVVEVDIPENPYLLDNDKMLIDQSDYVQERIQQANKEIGLDIKDSGITGDRIYNKISDKLGSDKQASQYLEKLGIKGIAYYEKGYDGHGFVIFNPDDIKVIQKFYQGEEQQPRAFIDFQDEANILVGMLNSADISYLPHEMVHGFTRLHVQNCIKYNKFNSIEGIMKYFGITDPMQLITNRDIQERMARMGIKYVQESEAPTAGLRRYFEMFKRFGKKLVSSWQSKGLIDEDALPDEVRKFFDSLLGRGKKQKIDYARIAEQKADVIQAIKRIKAGEAVDVSGLPITEVRKLMKVMQTRIPRMPQNLKNALIQAGGVDVNFAKNFDFVQTSGEEKNYNLFKRNGAINNEESLINFLESNGFITKTEMEDYEDTSAQWERVEQAMENMNNTYREQDMEQVLERQSIEEGIGQAQEIIKAVGAEDAFDVIEDIDKLKGRVVAEKEYLESLERKVANLDKDYKKLYDGLLKDQAREFAQETKEQVKQAKEEIKDYRNQVIDFIKKQDLELKDKAKLISVVKKANTKASFEKVINEVRERAADLYRKEQVRRLSDLIQKEVATKRPALKEQKYAYEENKLFSDLRDWNKLNKSEAGIRYQAMHSDEDFMNNLTREDEIRLLFLEYKAMGANSSPQLLNTLLNYIEIAKQVGMEARNEEEYQKAMGRDEVKDEMIKQLETRKGKPTVYVKFVANLYSSLNTIFGKNIADKYELETVQNKANIHAANHIDKVVKEAMKLYNVKSKGAFLNIIAELGKKAATITTVNNNIDTPLSKVGITKELSTLEIMDIYNAIKNEKTRDDYYYWYGKDQIDSLLSKLTNNEMIWADMMMQSIDERYAPVNESFIKNYYTDLPKVDNYWPATSEHKEVKTVFDVQGDFNQQSPSFLKERVAGRVLPKPTNAYAKYTKHIKGTYWVTDMADKQVELLNALSSLRVKNAIENKLGKDTYGALKRQVEALSFGGLMEDVDYVTGIIDKAINNVVVAKISLGIPVFTGQLSSVGLYSENMGVGEWALGFAEGLAHPVQTYKFMKENVGEFLEARFGGGYDETIESVLRESEDGKAKYSLSPKTKYNVVQALTSFVRTGDIGAIIYGGYPRLKQLLATMPREEAIKQFEKETLRGQQASVAASKSAFQQRKGMTRVFTSFRNFQYQAVRKIVDSVYGYMNGEVSAKQAGKTIALYALYSPIAYELFRQLGNMLFIGRDAFKDIGEKLFNTILMQELSIVPIVNDIVNYAIKKYLGQYAKSGITTVGIDDLFRAVDKAYKNDKDIYDYGEIVSPFIEMITGAPSQRIISTTKKVLEKYK